MINNKNLQRLFFLITLCFIFFSTGCYNKPIEKNNSLINTSHLDFLYENILLGKDTVGIIHIYSNYPDYKWTGDDDEGIACVDDAARAALFYIRYYHSNEQTEYLNKAKEIVKFLLQMQAENGFFYNFIWPDHSINKTFKTSVAEPNWWSWRAILTLSEAYPFFEKIDKKFSNQIREVLDKAVIVTLKWLNKNYSDKIVKYGGFEFPTWLPYETAADQSAVLLEGLTNYYRISKSDEVQKNITRLVDGIIMMQKGDSTKAPYFAFLSWQNTWHAWGNNQASALIKAGLEFKNDNYINSAINEINNFYPFLFKINFISNFIVDKNDGQNEIKDITKFPQIAYGIRPMVVAAMRGYKASKDTNLLNVGIRAAEWLFGNNPTHQIMYNPKTGRCFDGINNETEINQNSGAESTIEALLTLISIEENPTAVTKLHDYYVREQK